MSTLTQSSNHGTGSIKNKKNNLSKRDQDILSPEEQKVREQAMKDYSAGNACNVDDIKEELLGDIK